MNKELKKSIEAELNLLITDCLNKRNKKSADEIARHIKDAARHVARKFVKHLPETVAKPKTKTATTASAADKKKPQSTSKTTAKKKTAVKKRAAKAKK